MSHNKPASGTNSAAPLKNSRYICIETSAELANAEILGRGPCNECGCAAFVGWDQGKQYCGRQACQHRWQSHGDG